MEGILSGRHNNMALYWETLNRPMKWSVKFCSILYLMRLISVIKNQGYVTLSQTCMFVLSFCDVFGITDWLHRYYRYAPVNRTVNMVRIQLKYILGIGGEMSLGPVHCVDLSTGMAKVLGSSVSKDRPSISHPESSSRRNNFLAALAAIQDKYKVQPYLVSMSRRTAELGFPGIRYCYHADLVRMNAPELYLGINDPVADDSLLVFVDRDYYFDMNLVLSLGKPVMMYHFWPDEAAQVGAEINYWFQGDGKIAGRCLGSEDWSHFLWQYPSDKLMVADGYIQWVYRTYFYRLGPNRRATLLKPLNWIDSSETIRLEHFNPVKGKTVVVAKDGGRDYVSIGLIDSDVSYTIELSVWQGLVSSATARGCDGKLTPVTTQDVRERLSIQYGRDVSVARQEAAWLYPALLGMREAFGEPLEPYHPYFATVTKAGNYQLLTADGDLGDERAKPSTIEVCQPFVSDSSVSPAKDCVGNDYTMITDRVLKPQEQSDMDISDISAVDVKYISEFTKLLFPDGPTLIPTDERFVNEKMSRPSQVADRLRCESEVGQGNASSSFTKAESYRKVNAPRLITQVKSMRKWIYAKYIYPLAEYLKTLPMYAPGKIPAEVADRVSSVCEFALIHGYAIAKTDYSRFDGTVNAFLRYFFFEVLRMGYGDYVFSEEGLKDLNVQMFLQEVVTALGPYFTGFALGSGMMDTSCIGGLCNMFNAYSYLRDIGFSPEEAWRMLGIYQGDDGLSVIPHSPEAYIETVRRHGQVLELDLVTPGCGRVEFLARVYSPRVWYGSTDSCCDIDRQLSKLSRVTAGNKNRPLYALWCKARGYLITDPNTPIISNICHSIDWMCESLAYQLPPEVFEGMCEKERNDNISYWALRTLESGSPFPNDNEDGWMNDYCDEVVPGVDQEAMLTWLAGLQRPPSTLPRIAQERLILSALNDRPSFEPAPVNKYKGNEAKTVVIDTGKDAIVSDGHSPVSAEKPDEPSPKHTTEDFAYLNYISKGNPWGLGAGGLKCLSLVGQMLFDVINQSESRKKVVIYTGAKGDTQLIAAKLLSSCRARLIFVDPGFTDDDVKELSEYVVVRRTRMNLKMMTDAVEDAKKHGNNAIFWIDDAFSKTGPDPWAMFNDMKLKIFEAIKSDLFGASVKLMIEESERELLIPHPDDAIYFRTPDEPPFHPVKEIRMLYVPDPSRKDLPNIKANLKDIKVGNPGVALMCRYLARCEEVLSDPRNIRSKPARAPKNGDQGGKPASGSTSSREKMKVKL